MAMFRCYYCQKPVASNATKCPQCGGVFDPVQKGSMRGAYMAENGGKTGCGRPLLIGLGIFVVLIILGQFVK